jgi:hypothetical protein
MSNLARMIDQELFAVYCTRTRKQLYVLASTAMSDLLPCISVYHARTVRVLAVESDLTPTGMAVEIQPSPLMHTRNATTGGMHERMNLILPDFHFLALISAPHTRLIPFCR